MPRGQPHSRAAGDNPLQQLHSPLEAVKSMATVKFSCVLVGESKGGCRPHGTGMPSSSPKALRVLTPPRIHHLPRLPSPTTPSSPPGCTCTITTVLTPRPSPVEGLGEPGAPGPLLTRPGCSQQR